ncbi:MAG: nitronate monooxygenase [Deltaproteobacteria bacterium]|nr:nitronate monooxygenase [Deltaproteobacteria bacterium]
MEWKTRITDMLGCRYPIIEGAYAKQGSWKFAASVAKAGCHGLITATTPGTPAKLRESIKRCREAIEGSGGSFGVNISIGICPEPEKFIEVCIEEKVPLETAVYRPDALAPLIKEGGLLWMHKSARVKDAVHAEHLGADAVIVVGLEGTGFKQAEQMPTMLTTLMAKKMIQVPFVSAGGIGEARGFLGALAMGADGVMMGTAFMATKEFPVNSRAKEAIVKVDPFDLELRHRVIGTVDPKVYEEVLSLRDKVPWELWLSMLERVNLKDPDWKSPPPKWSEAEMIAKLRVVSLAAAFVDSVPTVKDFIDGIIGEAEALIDSYRFLKTR